MPNEVENQEQLFRLMVANVRDYAIFMLDPTGHIATWNQGAERIKGYTAEEIIGKHFSVFYPRHDVEAGKCEMELRVAAETGRFEDENWRVRKDGTQFWANVLITAVHDDAGKLVGFAKVTRDLTERKRAEEETTARLAAERANRAKDEFLAMLGHELRNPLAPILTALQLIKLRGEAPLKEHEVIERQVKHMMHLVDDLLDVSRITKGKLELRKKPIDMRSVLAKAIEIASPLLEQRGHHFGLDAPNWPVGVDGDEARLTQVVANLLTNAAKYTEPRGRIELTLRERDDVVEVEVTDNGAGIDKQLLPRIFDLFVQGNRSAERTTGGLGIGLTLVKQLVELHGGTVRVRSDGPGEGSTFTVRLPAVILDAPAHDQRPRRIAKASTPRRILLVDDNEDALMLLAEALEAAGHTVKTATDAAEALDLIESFKPELAILDIGLPVMDGYELATKICSRFNGSSPRMFALTGYGQKADREKSREAGFSEHFVKPVDVKQLIERISSN
ncbi:MAG TPA: ATP-binding protein [Kofleriaceae bacterium]|nr:ATP-binding protein [Kofleriaceae bacterium]